MAKRQQSSEEEIANAVSHAIGIVFSIISLPLLWYKSSLFSNKLILGAALVYGFGMLLVFVNSTLYHWMKNPVLKAKLQIADHISIYFLIAGTYTPIVVLFLPNPTKFLILLWALVLIGTAFKLYFTNRFKLVSVLFYLGMGWLVLVIITPIKQNMPTNAINLLIIGGLCYSIGVIFYVLSNKKYFHTIWHVFVLGGMIAHYFTVFLSLN